MHRPLVLGLVALLAIAVGAAGCRRGPRTKRLHGDAVVDVGTDWNQTDTQKVTRELLAQLKEGAPFLERHAAEHGGKVPDLKVGAIVVRADGDLIHTENISLDLEAYLVNSGRAKAVMAQGEEMNAAKELAWQDVNASDETRKKAFQQIGADYLLYGYVLATTNTGHREMTRSYTVWLKAAEIQTGRVVWIGKSTVDKYIKL